MKNYSVLPAHDHTDDCDLHDIGEQPETVEVWLHKGDDGDVDIMVVNPDETVEWLNDFSDSGSVAYEKKDITGLMIRFGYAPTTEWETIDLLGEECVRSFTLTATSNSDTA
jgi:hypothetical protein